MLSEEEINNMRKYFDKCIEKDTTYKEDLTIEIPQCQHGYYINYAELVKKIVRLEEREQKLIEKLEEDKIKEFDDCVIYLLETYLKILKGGKLMSKAEEMFEELGYRLEFEDEISFTLANRKEARYITFIKESKTLMLTGNTTMQELQAINEKVKEMRWLDE